MSKQYIWLLILFLCSMMVKCTKKYNIKIIFLIYFQFQLKMRNLLTELDTYNHIKMETAVKITQPFLRQILFTCVFLTQLEHVYKPLMQGI